LRKSAVCTIAPNASLPESPFVLCLLGAVARHAPLSAITDSAGGEDEKKAAPLYMPGQQAPAYSPQLLDRLQALLAMGFLARTSEVVRHRERVCGYAAACPYPNPAKLESPLGEELQTFFGEK